MLATAGNRNSPEDRHRTARAASTPRWLVSRDHDDPLLGYPEGRLLVTRETRKMAWPGSLRGYRPRVEVDGERIFSHRLVDVSWSRK